MKSCLKIAAIFFVLLRICPAFAAQATFGKFKSVNIEGAPGAFSVSNAGFHLRNPSSNGTFFVFQPFFGNGQISARVRRTANSPAKIGVLFRQNTNSISLSAGTFLAGKNTVFERVPDPKQPTTTTVSTNETFEWLRVVREGNAFSGFYSSDGTNWIQFSADTVEMAENIFGGLLIAGAGEADFENLKLTSAHLTSPLPGSIFMVPTNILLQADTTGFGAKVSRLEFFSGPEKIGETDSPTRSITWSNALAGIQPIIAKVTTTPGAEFFTEPVHCTISLPKAQAHFHSVDEVTKGDWKGVYGKDGFSIPGDSTNDPIYLQTAEVSYPSHTWGTPGATDQKALQRAYTDKRVGTHWYNRRQDGTIFLDLTFADGNPHRVSFYFMDWDKRQRVFEVQAIDSSGQLLASQKIAAFSNGKYLSCSVIGRVTFKITRISGGSIILNGLFFDREFLSAKSLPTIRPPLK